MTPALRAPLCGRPPNRHASDGAVDRAVHSVHTHPVTGDLACRRPGGAGRPGDGRVVAINARRLLQPGAHVCCSLLVVGGTVRGIIARLCCVVRATPQPGVREGVPRGATTRGGRGYAQDWLERDRRAANGRAALLARTATYNRVEGSHRAWPSYSGRFDCGQVTAGRSRAAHGEGRRWDGENLPAWRVRSTAGVGACGLGWLLYDECARRDWQMDPTRGLARSSFAATIATTRRACGELYAALRRARRVSYRALRGRAVGVLQCATRSRARTAAVAPNTGPTGRLFTGRADLRVDSLPCRTSRSCGS